MNKRLDDLLDDISDGAEQDVAERIMHTIGISISNFFTKKVFNGVKRLIRNLRDNNGKGGKRKKKSKSQKTIRVGTMGKRARYAPVGDAVWKKIAKIGKDDSGIVIQRQHMHATFQGRKLVEYTIDIDYVNVSSKDCDVVEFELWPLLQYPGSKRDGLYQQVEVLGEGATLTGDDLSGDTHERRDVRDLTFCFDKEGIKARLSGSRHLSLKITPDYQDKEQEKSVSPDMSVSAGYRAIRELIMSASFSANCLPKNKHARHWVTEYGRKYKRDEANERHADLEEGNICRVVYYGVHKQDFNYGMIWDWQTR